MSVAREAARAYVARGWNPLPLPFKSKIPPDKSWQLRVIREHDLLRFFCGKPQNVGVVLGPTSNGLTDVDLDCSEAIELAPQVLQPTAAIFGRQSAPASHWLYRSSLASTLGKATIKFQDPTRPADEATLLEVRVGGEKGAQTVFPGSVHESDEEIRWDEAGEPAETSDRDLLDRARLLASACLFARYWPGQGARHDAALTLGGFLARVGLTAPRIKYLVEAIARAAGDAEYQDRHRAAEDAAHAFYEGKNAAGFPLPSKTFGKEVAAQVAEWLEYSGPTHDNAPGDSANESGPLHNGIVTEDSAGIHFVDLHGDDLRFCHSSGAWYRWQDTHWVQDKVGVAFQYARKLARQLTKDQDRRKRYITGKTSFASGVERFAKHDPKVRVTADYWDTDPWLLGTPGGTVDLRTGKLRPATRADGITKSTSVAPNDKSYPQWRNFLSQTTGDDLDLIRFLQQWCGYCLTGTTREHALVFVYGPGGNGKSVFLNVIVSILKDYATTSAMDTFTASHGDKHPTDIATLRGARLVTASETEEGKAWAESRIKQMTGGDRLSARFMRQDFFEFTPQFKLMIVGNHRPVLRNVDEAARRRFLIVPFKRKPAHPDTELEQKLISEAPGILQWAIEGCLDWQANGGLVRPASVIAATEEYFSDQDLFKHWLVEECDREPGNMNKSATSSGLFKSWKEFAIAAGHTPGTRQSFGDQMARHGFRYYRGKMTREYFGIALKPKASFSEER